jgi:hypothetical protein
MDSWLISTKPSALNANGSFPMFCLVPVSILGAVASETPGDQGNINEETDGQIIYSVCSFATELT